MAYSDTGVKADSRPRARIGWVDVAKGIAILLVIVGHTLSSGGMPWKAVFSFHMPLFFILAGYTFRARKWGELVPSSARRLLFPYVLMFLLLVVRSDAGLFLEPCKLLESLSYALAYQPKQLAWIVMYLGWEFRELDLATSLRGWKLTVLAAFLWALTFAWSGLEMGARDYTAFPLAVVCACAGSFVCVNAAMFLDSAAQEGAGLIVPVTRYLAFMGRESMAVFCVHCFEFGVIAWRKLPFLVGVPGEGLVAGIVRVTFASLIMLLMGIL